MRNEYADCQLCPRSCGTNRLVSNEGFCGEGAALRLAFAGLHRGEEPPLSGKNGSGTVFVSGCNLGCVFCQNGQISQQPRLGRAVSTDEFTALCLDLQNRGAENINIVTGSHAVPTLAQYIHAAKSAGLRLPVLWNSSAYEKPETLQLLDGLIDTWLPDLKTLDSALAARFFNAPDYPQAATAAIVWMMRNKPGSVIIRHLILPGCLDSTHAVLRWFSNNAKGNAQLSLMTQYTPMANSRQPDRFVNRQEYETVLGWLEEYGIDDGFCQELVTGSDWLPDFNRPNPFSSDLSVAVWHF